MYLQHFGLKDYPFSLTPDTGLYFPWSHPADVLSALRFSLERGDGLLKVTGEVGSGKTLLTRLLLQELENQGWATAYLNVPLVDTNRLPLEVAREFGLNPSEPTEAYRELCGFLLDLAAEGKPAALVVDEAQVLGRAGLETIRLLSNLETDKRKLLPIILFGQPELDELLARHDLRQVAQRVAFSFSTSPMPKKLVSDYVQYRLQQCRLPGALGAAVPMPRFTPAAMRRLVKASQGWARLVHVLADKALMAAYAAGARDIDACHVQRAIKETPAAERAMPAKPNFWQRWQKKAA